MDFAMFFSLDESESLTKHFVPFFFVLWLICSPAATFSFPLSIVISLTAKAKAQIFANLYQPRDFFLEVLIMVEPEKIDDVFGVGDGEISAEGRKSDGSGFGDGADGREVGKHVHRRHVAHPDAVHHLPGGEGHQLVRPVELHISNRRHQILQRLPRLWRRLPQRLVSVVDVEYTGSGAAGDVTGIWRGGDARPADTSVVDELVQTGSGAPIVPNIDETVVAVRQHHVVVRGTAVEKGHVADPGVHFDGGNNLLGREIHDVHVTVRTEKGDGTTVGSQSEFVQLEFVCFERFGAVVMERGGG